MMVEVETFNHEKLDVTFPFYYKYNDNYMKVEYDENKNQIKQTYVTKFIDTEYTFGVEYFDFIFRHHIGLLADGNFKIGELSFKMSNKNEFDEMVVMYFENAKELIK